MSRTSTLTFTAFRRPRSLSLALVSAKPPILALPSEVALDIFELALLENEPKILVVVSKEIQRVINTIIYRTVTLDNVRSIQLFHRTITSRSSAELAVLVKALAITWSPGFAQPATHRLILDIATICTGARTLVLPSFYNTSLRPTRTATSGRPVIRLDDPLQLTMQSFDAYTPQYLHTSSAMHAAAATPIHRFASITHLRICEPSDYWYSPKDILDSFGALPYLTHLQLSRRAEANEGNDVIFVDHIKEILQTRKTLKMLVVSVFAPTWWCEESVLESRIWQVLDELAVADSRLFGLVGRQGEWEKSWDGVRLRTPAPVSFWETVRLTPAVEVDACVDDATHF
ncbi:hypothetical protein BDN72DRAFT_759323 [Pluteus cervinus]|uniref:Uncharacterized protein n=1 Tax=Pluteus cervinus TaxID=181527 RepID=A0ACD3B9H4_9AGAR|nr:hypothetical protein BDN72DRAFT_759323 [Pluteus cervinus]